jgi:EVE domain
MTTRNYWIGVVSKAHVEAAVAGGFTQLNYGRAGHLERMREGDGFVFYSPRTDHQDGDRVQAFTAIGRIANGAIFQGEPAEGIAPFRRTAAYFPAHDAPIKPLLDSLTFIRNKDHWGATFRFGAVRVPAEDFARIAAAMGRDFATDFPP